MTWLNTMEMEIQIVIVLLVDVESIVKTLLQYKHAQIVSIISHDVNA